MRTTIVLTVFLIAVTLTAGGCNIIAGAAFLVEGPPKVDAQHDLANVSTVVYVDDRGNRIAGNPRAIRREIADVATRILMEESGLTTTIRPGDALALTEAYDNADRLMPVHEIGERVGVDQIIYIEILAFSATSDGVTPRPTAAAQVRVIDVSGRRRVFPAPDEPPVQIQVSMREIDPALLRSRSSRQQVYRALAQELASQIAKVFYKHERRELGGNLYPR